MTAINGNLHANMCTVRELHIFWITGLLPDSISSRAHLILQSSQESRSSHCLIKGLRRPASHHGLQTFDLVDMCQHTGAQLWL